MYATILSRGKPDLLKLNQKHLGAYNLVQLETGLEGIGLASLTRGGPVEAWRPVEVQVLLAKARQDLRNSKIHAQYDL
jgi:hypothetical protein